MIRIETSETSISFISANVSSPHLGSAFLFIIDRTSTEIYSYLGLEKVSPSRKNSDRVKGLIEGYNHNC